jgi:pimeloyl-ACP methyl ester carboxylesterase
VIKQELLELPDGRQLEVLSNSSAKQTAVVFHHGTPSDGTLWRDWLDYLDSRGLGAVSYSRAGYGKSSRNPGRNVLAVNQDINAILGHFKIEKFIALGWSGGGPHAIASTLLTSCLGAITLASVGTFGAADLDFLAGMGEENEIEFGAAVAGPTELEAWMDQNAVEFAKVTAEDLKEALGGLISQPDKDLLFDHYAETMSATFQNGLANGYWGWFDDDLAFVKHWGFELSQITKPVELWQGDQDLMVPHAHGIWLEANLPNARLVFKVGEGHLSLGENAREEITDSMFALLKN